MVIGGAIFYAFRTVSPKTEMIYLNRKVCPEGWELMRIMPCCSYLTIMIVIKCG